MTGSRVLDVAVGLSFTYVLLSLMCSAINEIIAGLVGLRQGTLERGVRQLLGGSAALQRALYDHPLLKSIHHGATGRTRKPSYISADLFSAALLDVIRTGKLAEEVKSASAVISTLMTGTRFGEKLDREWKAVGDWVEGERAAVGRWFDEAMDRVSGAYKRSTQLVLFLVAAAVALAVNADSVTIARALWADVELRKAVAAEAGSYVSADLRPASGTAAADLDAVVKSANEKYGKAMARLDALSLPVGWPESGWSRPGETPAGKVLGLLATVITISLGAPFWFDALSRLANLRSAGARPKSAAAGE